MHCFDLEIEGCATSINPVLRWGDGITMGGEGPGQGRKPEKQQQFQLGHLGLPAAGEQHHAFPDSSPVASLSRTEPRLHGLPPSPH